MWWRYFRGNIPNSDIRDNQQQNRAFGLTSGLWYGVKLIVVCKIRYSHILFLYTLLKYTQCVCCSENFEVGGLKLFL